MLTTASVTLGAQAPQTTPTPQPPDNPQPTITQTPTRAMPANPSITISGCLKEEKDVPALKPSPVERAGLTEDYVLTDVKISPGSSVSGIGVSSKYEIEGIAEAELKKHLNHQVEITGTVQNSSASATGAGAGATAGAAAAEPMLKVDSVKMVSAMCQ